MKSKHIDFIICDREMHLLSGVELDGDFHLSPEETNKDEFKNMLFQKIDLQLVRIEDKADKYEEQIDDIIQKIQEKREEKFSLYLKIPFNEKDDAKKLGAKYDDKLKKWYVTNWKNYPAFDKWILGSAEEKLIVHDTIDTL